MKDLHADKLSHKSCDRRTTAKRHHTSHARGESGIVTKRFDFWIKNSLGHKRHGCNRELPCVRLFLTPYQALLPLVEHRWSEPRIILEATEMEVARIPRGKKSEHQFRDVQTQGIWLQHKPYLEKTTTLLLYGHIKSFQFKRGTKQQISTSSRYQNTALGFFFP